MRPTCRSSARPAPPGTTPWSPAGAPIRLRCYAIVAVYTTLDDTSEVWDLIPMMEFLIENTTDPNRISFLVTTSSGSGCADP